MLREVQQSMAASLIEGDARAAAHIRGGKVSSARRLDIYRHNVMANLCGALKDIFPVVQRIVGEAFFRHAAGQFVRATPSRSGDLNAFGREWPAFLAGYPHAAELPYLADVARLEWAWHECFHAADAAPLDVARLATIDPAAHGALVFRLHPAVRLLDSPFPVVRIWQVNQPEFSGDMAIDWARGGDAVLVRRERAGVEVVIGALPTGEYHFLCALQSQQALEAASQAALEADATFDLPPCLIAHVQSGAIVDFT